MAGTVPDYDNARLVEALWRVAEITGNSEYRTAAEKMLGFLTDHSFIDGCLEPVGNGAGCAGFVDTGGSPGTRARYDQQTIERGVCRTLLSGRGPGAGERGEEWFYGRNAHRLPPTTRIPGGCYDGLTPDGLNPIRARNRPVVSAGGRNLRAPGR